MLNRVQLKAEAKSILRTAKVNPFWFALLFLVLSGGMQLLDGYVSGSFITYINNIMPEIPVPSFLLHGDFNPTVVIFVTVMVWLLDNMLMVGWSIYHLGIRRGETMGYASLFDGFSFVGKVILLSLATSAIISLGLTLFVIPGVIFSYMYRFAYYNLCEDPSISVLQAMRMSVMQTRGFKAQLFTLDVSFFGWGLVTMITGGIAAVWVLPYVEQTSVGYFEQCKRLTGVGCRPSVGPEEPHKPYDPEL